LKLVRNRGAAGHKGVFSVFEELKTIDFVRFRLGISHSHAGQRMEGGKKATKFDTRQETESFVLAPFDPEEKDEVKKLIKKTVKAMELALTQGLESAMNKFN
jgi:PTH1 family peptidyl-tRNA hydrolase